MIENKVKEENVKKPIYKKWWFIVLAIILVLIIAYSISNSTKGDKIVQSKLELGSYLPELPNKKGKIDTNTKERLDIDLYNVDKETYNSYLSECKLKFTKDDTSYLTSLHAFNNENYKISMSYYESSKEMSINLDAPRKLTNIIWPNSDVANSLPRPKSTMGEIYTDKSNEFIVYIGNTTIDDYNEYVNTCLNSNYKVDYKKTSKEYTAKNSNGYNLTVSYEGGDVMYIKVKPEDTSSNTSNSINQPSTNVITSNSSSSNNTTSTNKTGISKQFKDAMDSYEAVMNEYVEFMKKYNANPTDATLISKYATMLQKYSEQISAFDKWKSEEMTTEETAYYIDVQSRVSKKLLEVNQ